MSALSYLSVINVTGEQAKEFLQGQVSCDIDNVSQTQASLGTLCNLKGRMMASFIVAQQTANVYIIILHASLKETIIKDLKKYSIFSKADISASEQKVFALKDTGEKELLSARAEDAKVSIYLPEGRALIVASTEDVVGSTLLTPEENMTCDIQDELPWITQDTADKFLPQAFFSDASTAVSYEKGCYKGQEIVARMHFRGQMKEGLKVIENQNYTVGQELRDENKKLQGTVVWASSTSTNALAVMKR